LQFASGDVFQRSLYSSIDASVCLNSVTTVFLLARSSHFLVRSTPVVRTRGSHFQFTFYRFAISQFAVRKLPNPDRRSHLWAPPAAGLSTHVPVSTPPAPRNVLEWFHSCVVKCGRVRYLASLRVQYTVLRV